ncbi:stage II sporulation protein D [Paenibacillus catalpae]|uniref:Stage II sporulation protein D n=1 Tax=Paenibacillus catalpae TaxID=1045775 RepID=A0A1I2H2E0_9BACL|nr:stage II sporulation protein D [Paenibacillus catalpae]SFF24285.1 stage II sporulation protein D [Paenibacillus catalpae]
MRYVIGRPKRAIRRPGSRWFTAVCWTAFGIGIVMSISVMLAASAYRNAGTDNTDPFQGESGGVTSTNKASAGGIGQAPLPSKAEKPAAAAGSKEEQTYINVYLTKEKRTERVTLETYVRGVVAGEMPADFELEALKAQAIAARTYIVRRLELDDHSGMPATAAASQADVTDTISHQIYISLDQLKKLWPKDEQEAKLAKLNKAVSETRGKVITYGGEPIQAVFFSTSNGYTENSEQYFQEELPYLRSVASPWDKRISPRYQETVKLKLSDFYARLGLGTKKKPVIRVLDKTAGNRIADIMIDGKTYTGREVREKLGLASSQFLWKLDGDSIAITTFGYGHGVGMSQWGANGMAEQGKSAEQIVTYYYTDTKVEQASKLAAKT